MLHGYPLLSTLQAIKSHLIAVAKILIFFLAALRFQVLYKLNCSLKHQASRVTVIDFHCRTLFELNNNLALRYNSEQQLEYFLPLLADKNRDIIASYDASLSGQWKSVFFTIQESFDSNNQAIFSLTTHFGDETSIDSVSLTLTDVPFSNAVTSITIGEGFSGFLQDVRVYVPALQVSNDNRVIVPLEASFLPQCLCQSGFSFTQDETQCTMMDLLIMR